MGVPISNMSNSVLRWGAAMVLLTYGFAKLNGSQFTILDSELDKPLGAVSGFWLTWYYFGFSPFYGNLLALIQILGALLLTVRRTALMGACVLAPMLANIVLVDVFYGVEPGATPVAILLLMVMLWIIGSHWEDLRSLFFRETTPPIQRARGTIQWILRLSMLALAWAFTYWVANFNNRLPTPVDGAWDVIRVVPPGEAAAIPQTFFFEYNRAHLVIFKTATANQSHHFEVEDRRIRMWQTWLRKGEQIFDGRYSLDGSRLKLEGGFGQAGNVEIDLERRHVPRGGFAR
jgi:hypothetical protein